MHPILYPYYVKLCILAVAYLGFHFGGGGSNFFCKSGGICMARSTMQQKNNLKNSHFYMKITDNVLLCTIFRGIAAYTPQISCHLCDLVCFGVQFS